MTEGAGSQGLLGGGLSPETPGTSGQVASPGVAACGATAPKPRRAEIEACALSGKCTLDFKDTTKKLD